MNEIHRVRETQFYAPQVFFLQNLGFITPTEARQISFEEALKFEKIHLEAYSNFGYRCILIPAEPLEQRVQIILQHCQVFARQ